MSETGIKSEIDGKSFDIQFIGNRWKWKEPNSKFHKANPAQKFFKKSKCICGTKFHNWNTSHLSNCLSIRDRNGCDQKLFLKGETPPLTKAFKSHVTSLLFVCF